MAEAGQYLVSFGGVSASVAGYDISSIVEMQLSAATNGTPSLTLLVDGSNSGLDGSQEVSTVTLASVKNILDNLRDIVRTPAATLSLSLSVYTTGEKGDETQSIKLSGWMLTDVAVSPVAMGEACLASLTFMHPICKAHYGGIVPGLLSSRVDYTSVDTADPVSAFVSALGLYADAVDIAGGRDASIDGANSSTVRASLVSRLRTAATDLQSSVVFTGGGLPASSILSGWDEYIAAGIATSYAEPDGGNSVLHRFLGGLIPECSLSLGGDYTKETLEVSPFSPWRDADVTIGDSDIMSLQFPQHDPSPIAGVHMVSVGTGDSLSSGYMQDEKQASVDPADIFYVPQEELDKEYLYGPIQQLSEPGWLFAARSCMLPHGSSVVSDGGSAENGTYGVAVSAPKSGFMPISAASEADAPVEYSSAMLACAKAYYETSLMKDWFFSITARLMFKLGGTVLAPGQVISVSSGSGTVIGGFITCVTHVISVINKSAHTDITCTHPRFGAPPSGVSGSNALYE